MVSGVERAQLHGPAGVLQRLVGPAEGGEQVGVPVVGLGAVGVDGERAPEGRVGARPVPVVEEADHAERGVGDGEGAVERERPHRRPSRAAGIASAGRAPASMARSDLRVGQPGPGGGEGRVEADRLLEEAPPRAPGRTLPAVRRACRARRYAV